MRTLTRIESALFAKWGEAFEPVTLPHTWNAADGHIGKEYWRGIGTYRLQLPDPTPGKRQYIELRGANHVATVYCNGRELGTHKGGFSTFRYELTKALLPKNNTLEVSVSNAESNIYPQHADFTFYGGLYRDVYFVEVEDAHFDLMKHGSQAVFISAYNGGCTRADLFPINAEGCKIRLELMDAEGGGYMETFYCGTKISSGSGALESLKRLETRRLFLVADPFFRENGRAKSIADSTKAEQTEIFSDIQPDPSVEAVAAGTARLRAFAPDTVIALGGGSAMDQAKAMVHFSGLQVYFVAIPTTSGSGSEVTDFAVLTYQNTKHPLVDPALRPDMAVLDETLLTNLPKSLIADTGFDVLCHALEGFVATGAGSFTDALAREAFCLAYAHLPASFAGDTGVRLKVHEAATMAGMAFTQAGLGLCHAMAHTLGGVFHLPHGRLNAILLPAVVGCNSLACGKKYASLARSAGIGSVADSVAVRNLKNALVERRRELGLPRTLKEAGVEPRQLWSRAEEIVTATLADPCCKTNPLPVDGAVVRRVLEEVTGRG